MVPEWELTFALSNLAKIFLYLRTRLRETIVTQPTFQRRINVVSTLWINVEITLIQR